MTKNSKDLQLSVDFLAVEDKENKIAMHFRK